jgi:NAD(P)-dependent dehydrogenase (short-subunit alcohol dehydrogenase family)
MNITNKTVLITGASRGIGRALVEEALERGARQVYAGARGALQHPDGRVTPLRLDVTSKSEIQRAAAGIGELDLLVNNAGISLFDDFSDPDVIWRHMEVNALGMARVTQAFLPLLKRSRGAIVNNLSLAGIAPVPPTPSYSVSKAAAASLTQGLRMLLAKHGVEVHGVFLGPVDTEMSRGIEVPKAAPAAVAQGIFDGLERGEEDIFPDPMSRSLAEGWRAGSAKALERQFMAFVPPDAA